MLSGTIFITSNYETVQNTPITGEVMVVNMDEDHKLSKLIPNSIEGTILLPPVDAKIAEIDGDETKYNSIYLDHLYHQQDFMSAIIAFLYKGGNLLIYLPDEYNYTKQKLCEFIFRTYGIHIGDLEDPNNNKSYYDMKCIPFWLNILYTRDLITCYEWLLLMPLDAYTIEGVLGGNPAIFLRVVENINPYVESNDIKDKIQYVKEYHAKLHKNPKLIPALEGI